jgi:alpha-glucosidase/alpha-D-xyloside xylohydrolase
MRPLWLYYPGSAINEIDNQYLWGRDLLIAPVFQKAASTQKLFLPEGQWYDFWSSEIISGGREIVKDVDLSTMPIYVRAGAVIPMVPEIQHTSENQFGPLEIQIYPGQDGEFILYEDDGHSYDYMKDEYMKTRFSWDDAAAILTIFPENGMNLCPDNQREITIRLMSTEKSKSITYIGNPVTLSFQQ